MPIAITSKNFAAEVEQETKPIVMDLFASWCGPCQQMKPIFKELEAELGSTYKFAEVDVDEARDISIKYAVTSVPTFLFIKNGQVKGKEMGYMSKEDLKQKIRLYLD
jgi:thioredoxin 1